jgi:hypothetical protein
MDPYRSSRPSLPSPTRRNYQQQVQRGPLPTVPVHPGSDNFQSAKLPRKRRVFRRKHVGRRGVPALIAIVAAVLVITGGSYALLFSSAPNPSSTPIDLQKGLVGWWKFDGNALDSTPYADNGTVTGATLTTDRHGDSNDAYSFNGSGNYISIANASQLDPTSALSVSLWFEGNLSSSTVGGLIAKDLGGGGVNNPPYGLWVSSGKLTFFTDESGDDNISITSGTLSNSTWYHAVGTYDGTTMRLYINGSLIGTANQPAVAATTGNLEIGQQKSGFSRWFNGSIDDVRIYNRALSASEVTALYMEYSPSVNADSGESGLLGWWKLNGNTTDSTPHANNLTVTGTAPTATTDRHGVANSAESFNGSSYLTSSNINIANSAFTISFWANVSSWNSVGYGNSAGFIGNTAGSGSMDQWLHLAIRNQKPYFGFYNDDLTGTTVINSGQWYFYTFSVTAAKLKSIYVNGALDSSGTASGLLGTGMNQIGADAFDGDLNGSMQDVRVYNYALSSSQISNLYKLYNSEIALGGTGASGGINLGEGLVGEWNFDGNVYDNTPYSDNGTATGATLTTDRHGNSNDAYSFNGSSNYITVPDANQLSPSAITVSCWVYPTVNATGNFVSKGGNAEYRYRMNSGGTITFFDEGATNAISTTATIPLNQWSMVSVTGNSSNLAIYINGALSTSGGSAYLSSNTSNALWFGTYNSSSEFFGGTISHVRIYNRALSAAEIAALYKEY